MYIYEQCIYECAIYELKYQTYINIYDLSYMSVSYMRLIYETYMPIYDSFVLIYQSINQSIGMFRLFHCPKTVPEAPSPDPRNSNAPPRHGEGRIGEENQKQAKSINQKDQSGRKR